MILEYLGSKHGGWEEVAADALVEVVGGRVGEVGGLARCDRSRTVHRGVRDLLSGEAAGAESDSEGAEQVAVVAVAAAHPEALVVGQAEGMEAVMEAICYLGNEGCRSKRRPHSTSSQPARGRRSSSCPSDPALESDYVCTKRFCQY
mmetsp:Transcript_86956/g.261246  ORF Transcript_86956/g.261246 Transcript_86956/m.261246 type:complete len:147 (+) Transcript_86956:804-1244(+)